MVTNDTSRSVVASRLLAHIEKVRVWLRHSHDSLYLDGLTIGRFDFTFEDAAAGRPDDIDVLASYLYTGGVAEAEVRMVRDEFDEYLNAHTDAAMWVRNPPVMRPTQPPADDPDYPWVARSNESVAERQALYEGDVAERRKALDHAYKLLSEHLDQLVGAVSECLASDRQCPPSTEENVDAPVGGVQIITESVTLNHAVNNLGPSAMQVNQEFKGVRDVNNAISEKGDVIQTAGAHNTVHARFGKESFWETLLSKIKSCWKWLRG